VRTRNGDVIHGDGVGSLVGDPRRALRCALVGWRGCSSVRWDALIPHFRNVIVCYAMSAEESREYPSSVYGRDREHPSLTDYGGRAENTRALKTDEGREHPSLTDYGSRAEIARALDVFESRKHRCLPDLETEPRTSVFFRRSNCQETVAENIRATSRSGQIWSRSFRAGPFYIPRPDLGGGGRT